MNEMNLGHTIDYHNTVNTTSLKLQLVNTILYGLYYTHTDIINSFEPYSKTIILVVYTMIILSKDTVLCIHAVMICIMSLRRFIHLNAL